MAISVFDIYKVVVGPSSSHTFGPMVAAQRFLKELHDENLFERTERAQIEHFTDLASMLGLEDNESATLDSAGIPAKQQRIESEKTLNLGGRKMVPFDPAQDIKWYGDKSFPTHPNGIAFVALDADGKELKRGLYFSIGGGFVVCERESLSRKQAVGDKMKPFPYTIGEELAALCRKEGKLIAEIVFQNELIWRTAPEIKRQLLEIAAVKEKSIEIGLAAEGEIPGGLGLQRHAKEIWEKVKAFPWGAQLFELQDHINAYALALMEVNATLGQVVTAPTMGASGIVPTVLQAYKKFGQNVTDGTICDFLLTSAGCAIPVKINASFSGAEVGCQGEVGSASLMAATGLCQVLGGTVDQVLNSGAMALEHSLGLTCDPVAGLVQVPCIKRNALAANIAVNAVRLTMLRGEEPIRPTFDQVIQVLYMTGKDMSAKYKETSQGGLAVVWVDC